MANAVHLATLVLHILTKTHKTDRLGIALNFSMTYHRKGEGLLDRIIMGDETWVHHYVRFCLSRLNNQLCYALRHAQLHVMVGPGLLPCCTRALLPFTLQFLQCYQKLCNIIISWFWHTLFNALRFRV